MASQFALFATSWDNDVMPIATITVDAALKRLADLASQSGQRVDEVVEALLRRIAEADVRIERGVATFPRRPGADWRLARQQQPLKPIAPLE